jgi:hemolysin activation/secretion protein
MFPTQQFLATFLVRRRQSPTETGDRSLNRIGLNLENGRHPLFKLSSLFSLPIMLVASVTSVERAIAQNVPTDIPNPLPPSEPLPEQPPLLPPPEELLRPPSVSPSDPDAAPDATGEIPTTIEVDGFEVLGSTIFSDEELEDLLSSFINRPLSFAELLQARSAVTEYYNERGYITTGALIPPQTLENGIVKIQVVEGGLEEIQVSGTNRLSPNYIRSRLERAGQKPVNIEELLEALQLLQLNPLIENLSAELSAGTRTGENLLEVQIEEARAFGAEFKIDNGRSPSVGTFRQEINLNHGNLFGFGDAFGVAYARTEGSDQWDFDYTFPINSRNGTLNFSHSRTSSEIIEPPFDRVDIEAKSRTSEVTFRQPFLETPTREFALGLTAARRSSQTSLLGVDFPLSPGADDDGETRISALRFFQEWTERSSRQVLAARSQFSLGVGWFDATVNSSEPDSRFLTWRGQVQWLRVLGGQTGDPRGAATLLLRGDVQLSPEALVPLEQFGLGGFESVRGYRQDALLADNGAFASAEVRLPLYRTRGREFMVHLAPFVDVGTAWNSDGQQNPDSNTLVSVGMGLQLQLSDKLRARVDWGVPLVDINSRDRTWQENGIYFSVISNPF